MIPGGGVARERARAAKIEAILPLSPSQEGILFHALETPELDPYVVQICYSLGGQLDGRALRKAWETAARSHSALRTIFVWERRDRPLQIVFRDPPLAWEEHDFRAVAAAECAARLQVFLEADRARGFQLAKAPPIRLSLIALGDRDHRLVLTYHHILLDGWSLAIVLRRVLAEYDAGAHALDTLAAGAPQYRDFIAWLGRRDPAREESFWRRTLAGFRAPTLFRGAPPTGQGQPAFRDADALLSEAATTALGAFARAHHLTPNALIQGAWALVLRLHHQQDDVLFGTTVSGRASGPPGVEGIVGLLINTLPVRARVHLDDEIVPWLRGLQAQMLEMLEYEHSSLAMIRRWSELPGGGTWFDTLIVFDNYPVDDIPPRLGAHVTIEGAATVEATNYPLTISVVPGRQLLARATYDALCFAPDEVDRLLRHYLAALDGLATGAGRHVGALSLLSEPERRELLIDWNATKRSIATDCCVHELIAAQAARTPDAVAVECGNRHLCYRELDEFAHRLARRLRRAGVGPEVRVGLSLDRSAERVVAILAVLKAGGTWVPLDPSYPTKRLAWMATDAGLRTTLTEQRVRARLGALPGDLLCVEDFDDEREPSSRDLSDVTPAHLAYVMYTSGSTGTPRGVMVQHRSLAHYAIEAARRFELGQGDRVLQFASISFDTSVEEIFSCLVAGATLVVPPELELEPRAFFRACRDLRLTVLDLPTAYWHGLADELKTHESDLTGVRLVVTGGEQARSTPWATWRRRLTSHARLLNTYGPTEATVVATMFAEDPPAGDGAATGVPPIGRPIANVRVYLLDRAGALVPVGAVGEIHIGGAGVARGYLGRPRLTAEKFVPDPFDAEPGGRLYRTGDLGRYRSDGTLEFIGRRDGQVKIRGFRIEPGEAEAVLSQHPSVRDAAVVVGGEAGDKRLDAFVVARGSPPPGAVELRDFLKRHLPAYMIPATFEIVGELPRLPSGKIDRDRLRAASRTPDEGRVARPYVAPRTPIEEVLAGIWAQVLSVDRVGVNDDFFDLGGHSLLAIQVLSRLRAAFQIDLPMHVLFEAPIFSELARRVERTFAAEEGNEALPIALTAPPLDAPLARNQQRIWADNQSLPRAAFFNLGGALRLEGALDHRALASVLGEIIRRHEVLRTTLPLVNGRVVQRVDRPAPSEPPRFPVTDLRNLPPAERDAAAVKAIVAESYRPFDLTHDPPLRTSLLALGPEDHVLLLTMHHVLSDGWSVRVLLDELSALYDAFVADRPSPLPVLRIQYRDFAAWQQRWLQSDAARRKLVFWRERWAGLSVLRFPDEAPAPPAQSFLFSRRTVLLSGPHWAALKKMSRGECVTPFMTLLAALYCLLHRRSGATDIAVATQIANRSRVELEPMIGFFANTLLLRVDLSGNPTKRDVLRRARATTLAACAHADLPFDYIQDTLEQEFTPPRILFTLETAPLRAARLAGLTVTRLQVPAGPREVVLTGYDLIIQAEDRSDGLSATLQFNTDLFDDAFIDGITADWIRLLESLPSQLDARCGATNH